VFIVLKSDRMFQRISIRTRLPAENAADVVRALIRPEGFLGELAYASNDQRPFIGRSKGNRFEFRRRFRFGWHNSFVPFVFGNVRSIENGAVFDAVLRPHLVVLILTPAVFCVFGYEALRELFAGAAYAPVLFLSVFAGFAIVSYRYESREAERILREAFERIGGAFPAP
jgi:hypothetical protein